MCVDAVAEVAAPAVVAAVAPKGLPTAAAGLVFQYEAPSKEAPLAKDTVDTSGESLEDLMAQFKQLSGGK